MIVLIDNYDSFTFNLFHYLSGLGADVVVHRNDKISVADVMASRPDAIVLSPGPCTPNEAGICLALIEKAAPTIPILGVCLGHQAIGQSFGGKVVRAAPIHGKVWPIRCTEAAARDPLWAGLPQEVQATRYHSLVVVRQSLPACLCETALTLDDASADAGGGELMALRHLELQDFDAVLMDLKMPGMDGPALYREIAARHPALLGRIAAMTGDLLSAAPQAFLRDSALPVLHKPFEPGQVEAMVGRLGRARRESRGGDASD